MNVSTTYNYSSGFNTPIKQGGSASSSGNESQRWLPVPVKTPVNTNSYNYYVKEDTSEAVYNDKKNLRQIHHALGSVINIFA